MPRSVPHAVPCPLPWLAPWETIALGGSDGRSKFSGVTAEFGQLAAGVGRNCCKDQTQAHSEVMQFPLLFFLLVSGRIRALLQVRVRAKQAASQAWMLLGSGR